MQDIKQLLLRCLEAHDVRNIPQPPFSNLPNKSAAVLVCFKPSMDLSDEYGIILTQRCDHLSFHANQVAFPGGGIESLDGDNLALTALRETKEEIGIFPKHFEILGHLDGWQTVSGYQVRPYIAICQDKMLNYQPDANEVKSVFELPVGLALNLNNYTEHYKDIKEHRVSYHSLNYKDYEIWGFTAGILRYLAQLNSTKG